MNTSLRSSAFLLSLLCLALAGCAKHETPVSRGNHDGVLYRGSGTEPESLDPHVIRGVTEWVIASALYEGLVTPTPDSDRPSPGVASSWESSQDGMTYTFHLRAEARWSDGTPLTARDFAYSMERMLQPAMGSAHAEDTLLFIKGAKAFQNGVLKDFAEVGVKVVDAHTLVLTLENPTPFFLEALYQFYPVKQELVERFGSATDRSSQWARPPHLVTNGAYRVDTWRPAQELVAVKNPYFWDASRVRIKEIHFIPYENPASEETAFRNGQLHMTFGVPLQKIRSYQEQNPALLKTAPDYGNYFYSLNLKRPPLNDVRVRQALALSVDRDALAHKMLGGGREPAEAFTPKGLGAYKAPSGLVSFNPAEARRLLAEAGYPEGKGFPQLEILIDSRAPHQIVAETVQQMWRQHLGVEIRLQNQETRSLIASKRSFSFDLVRGSWNAATYRDPHYFLSSWQTGNLYNEAGWSNANFDRLIAEAVRTADPVRRLELFRQAEGVLLTDMPVIPLFYSAEIFLLAPSVKGWSGRPFADRLFKHLWLE